MTDKVLGPARKLSNDFCENGTPFFSGASCSRCHEDSREVWQKNCRSLLFAMAEHSLRSERICAPQQSSFVPKAACPERVGCDRIPVQFLSPQELQFKENFGIQNSYTFRSCSISCLQSSCPHRQQSTTLTLPGRHWHPTPTHSEATNGIHTHRNDFKSQLPCLDCPAHKFCTILSCTWYVLKIGLYTEQKCLKTSVVFRSTPYIPGMLLEGSPIHKIYL